MYKNIYCKSVKKIKVSATDLIMYKKGYKSEELLTAFLEEAKRCYCTSLSFPSKVASDRERQAQKQNYDSFIYTLADLIKKYAPELADGKEITE